MATRSSDINRVFAALEDAFYGDVPSVASDISYVGSAIGENGSGYGRPLQAADPFLGFCSAQCDNSAGSAGAKNIRVRRKGTVKASVTGVTGVGDIGATVYMSDDDTFTLASTGNTPIGKVSRFISGTTVMVAFEAVDLRSV